MCFRHDELESFEGGAQRESDLRRAKEVLDLQAAHAGESLSVRCTAAERDEVLRLALGVLTGDVEPEDALDSLLSDAFPEGGQSASS